MTVPADTTPADLPIALSAGGSNTELATHGLGEEHVNELMVRLARKLLGDGYRLAFGGTMGDSRYPLTELLIGAALGWLGEASARKSKANDPKTWPLVNYSAWPFHKHITDERRAQLVGVCDFRNVDPPCVTADVLEGLHFDWQENAQALRYTADALSEMRSRSAAETKMRIVWGGKIKGSIGWMAGIVEEVLFSLRNNKPILILGGFGGCASLLADFLLEPDASWPNDLSLAACANPKRDERLSSVERQQLSLRFDECQHLLRTFRTGIHQHAEAQGISSELILQGLRASSAREAISLAARAAKELAS